MSRADKHEFKNIYLASPVSVDTEISATSGVSLVSPGAGEFLQVWQIDVDGRASNAAATGVEIRDGSAGDLIRFVEVAAGDTKIITFGGLPKRFDTTIWIQTVGTSPEAARVAVHYVPRISR
jgi:hypothetical protein